jgi:prephenate dehydrogenase
MKHTILVAGLGLIGGSLAKAMAQSDDNTIIGYDTNEETIRYALEHHIIDQSYLNFTEAVQQADIIILATPISETIKLMGVLNEITFNKDIIVSDVSSVKGAIIETAHQFTNERITFIGGHPMAGSHKSGVRAAKEHLFENAIYVLTPTQKCSDEKLNILKEILKVTKCNFVTLNPDEHDEMTSVVSHFPHLIASSLVHQARKWENKHTYLPELAAGGFRDITRIASSNPEMWQDIFQHNGNKMSQLLAEWIEEMTNLKDVLDHNHKESMITYLKQAKQYRDGLNKTKKGAIRSFYDLYVDVKDKPGAIAMVVQMLAVSGISITNIRILEIRDGINGALRLSVQSKEDQIASHELLQKHGYEVTIEN